MRHGAPTHHDLLPVRVMRPAALALPLLLAISACSDDSELPTSNAAGPVKLGNASVAASAQDLAALPGTPMAQRSAVLGFLNKRNGLTRDITLKPGEAMRIGEAIVRLRACETAAPWENTPETGAFVQLDVESPADKKWRRVFSGWVFKERPDRNMVQHPIYDVWVKSCAMTWPEMGEDTVKVAGPSGSTPRASNAQNDAVPPEATDSPVAAPNLTPATASPSTPR